MGLLDDLLGGMLGDDPGQARTPQPAQRPAAGAGAMGGVMTALLPVLLSMLASRAGAGQGGGGGLGDVLGQVLGGGARRGGGLGDVLGSMLGRSAGSGGGGGPLGGLLEQMQRAGYGDQARSWVGTGANMPISPGALGEIFGRDGLEEIARRANLTPQETSEGLSTLLPEVVDHVTPSGQVPDLDQLTLSVDNLRRRLGA